LLCDKLVERKTHHLKHEKAAQVPQPDLKLGARFRLTQLGAERCPKFCGNTGSVVGFARNSGGIRVLLDGTKRPRSLHQLRTRFSAKDPLLNKRLDGTTIGTSSSSCIDRRSSLVSSLSGKVSRTGDGLLYCVLLRRAIRERRAAAIAFARARGFWRTTAIRFPDRIRCTLSVCGEAGHDDIYHSCVKKRPNQSNGPHKSCHRYRQSPCA
jgi:hypothetical protein